MSEESDRKTLFCPLMKEDCTNGHTESMGVNPATKWPKICRLWVHVRGKHPQSRQDVDYHDCSYYWTPIAMLEGSQMSRMVAAQVSEHTKAWVDSLPSDIQKHVMERATRGLLMTVAADNIEKLVAPPPPKLNSGDQK